MSYFRAKLVARHTRAFETIGDERVNVCLCVLINTPPSQESNMSNVVADQQKNPREKAQKIHSDELNHFLQSEQLKNPDSIILFDHLEQHAFLSELAFTAQGFATSDNPPFIRCFWELGLIRIGWVPAMSAPSEFCEFCGRSELLLWENGNGAYFKHAMALKREGRLGGWKSGRDAWGREGVLVSEMGQMSATIYTGEMFDHTAHALIPKEVEMLGAIWAFASSPDFREVIRKLSQKLNVTNQTLVKVPFDLAHWQKIAANKYPKGLPKPHSDDPTQWLFNGNPSGSEQPLQVAVARLLGYRWPRQTGSSFPDCPALNTDRLEDFTDEDGIICTWFWENGKFTGERLNDVHLTIDDKRAARVAKRGDAS